MYGGNSSGVNGGDFNIKRIIRNSNAPVTWFLIAANLVTFLVGFFTMRAPLAGGPFWWLELNHRSLPYLPWTLVTWPLVASLDLIGIIFGVLWTFSMGGSLERAWSSRVFGLFMAATAAITGLTLWGGSLLLQTPFSAQGLWLAMAAPTVAWCVLNRAETVRFNLVLPIPASVLMWITMGMAWFFVSVGSRHPLLGLFALSGCGAAYWYVTKGRNAYRGYTSQSRPSRGSTVPLPRRPGFSPANWWKSRQRKKVDQTFEEILRRSGYDVPAAKDDKKGR